MQVKSNKYFPFIIFILITVISLVPYADAMSGKPYSPESCRGIQLCESLEGKEFDMIRYSFGGSELIILYDRSKSGEIYPTSMQSLYDRSRGTVNDAVLYLSQNPDYDRFIIRSGWKSTGWFKTEDLDSVYLILPRYYSGEIEAPEYTFFEKEGKLKIWIRPVIRTHSFGDD
jgi:hypothetical protein